jgi:uncharacterized protein (DUF2164 family)
MELNVKRLNMRIGKITDQERNKIYKHVKQFMKENPEVNVEKMIAEILLDEIEKEKNDQRTNT